MEKFFSGIKFLSRNFLIIAELVIEQETALERKFGVIKSDQKVFGN